MSLAVRRRFLVGVKLALDMEADGGGDGRCRFLFRLEAMGSGRQSVVKHSSVGGDSIDDSQETIEEVDIGIDS